MKARLVSLLLFLFSFPVMAHDHHHESEGDIYSFTYGSDGVSLSIAMSAIQFDLNVKDLQIGVGGGFYEDQYGNKQTGVAVGVGKRLCATEGSCGIINFSAGTNEGGGSGLSVGFTWKL